MEPFSEMCFWELMARYIGLLLCFVVVMVYQIMHKAVYMLSTILKWDIQVWVCMFGRNGVLAKNAKRPRTVASMQTDAACQRVENTSVCSEDTIMVWFSGDVSPLSFNSCNCNQWRRQDLLRGRAKMEIMSWGTHDGLRGRVQQLLDD